jgi:hypothetical protein
MPASRGVPIAGLLSPAMSPALHRRNQQQTAEASDSRINLDRCCKAIAARRQLWLVVVLVQVLVLVLVLLPASASMSAWRASVSSSVSLCEFFMARNAHAMRRNFSIAKIVNRPVDQQFYPAHRLKCAAFQANGCHRRYVAGWVIRLNVHNESSA